MIGNTSPPSIQWLTVRQTAAQLGNVSTKLVYKLYHRGELLGAKIAGTVRIRAASVMAYLDAHSNSRPVEQAEGPGKRLDRPTTKRGKRRPAPNDFTSYYRREMERVDQQNPG